MIEEVAVVETQPSSPPPRPPPPPPISPHAHHVPAHEPLCVIKVAWWTTVAQSYRQKPEHLVPGSNHDRLLVTLFAADGETRLFDQSLSVRADSGEILEWIEWDYFCYSVPDEASEVTFEIYAGGETFLRTIPCDTNSALLVRSSLPPT